MAVCPFAENRLIPPGSSDPRISPRVAILHVDAGNTRDLHDYFDGPSGGIESHFHIALDGTIFQYRDTNYEADANYKANPFAVSIETQGYGAGTWTAAQMASIKRLLLWLNEVHPAIRLQKCPTWDGSGVGYHIQFGTPGWWTNVSKSCPGPDRIRQYHDVIVPWLNDNPTSPEDDMPYTPAQLTDIVRQAVAAEVAPLAADVVKLREQNARIRTRVNASAKATKAKIARGNATLAEIAADVDALAADVAQDDQ